MRIFIIVIILIAIATGVYLWKNLSIPKTTGLINGELQPCPKSPNCVNCQAQDEEHSIQPLPYIPGKSLDLIESFLFANYNAVVVAKTPTYMHVVVTTPVCRFKDDLEFLVDEKAGVVCVRSASRVGYGDGNTNRTRIEKLREFLTNVH